MDVKTKVRLTNLDAIKPTVIAKILPTLIEMVQDQIDAYLKDLESHMGKISGESSYTGDGLHWEALDEDALEDNPKYWYKTGKAKSSISVNFKPKENGVTAFVGIAENAPGYQEALWNEIGFTPRNGDTLVRRPLFFPLAEEHQAILKERIKNGLAGKPIHLEV